MQNICLTTSGDFGAELKALFLQVLKGGLALPEGLTLGGERVGDANVGVRKHRHMTTFKPPPWPVPNLHMATIHWPVHWPAAATIHWPTMATIHIFIASTCSQYYKQQ